MAIVEKKKIKTNKLTGKNIITTVIYNDQLPNGFGGAVKKIDINNTEDKYARQNKIDNVFDKISGNARKFEAISKLNEFDFEFTMGAGSANKKDFDAFVRRLNRKCDKQGLSHVQYVYMTCLSYDADIHFHGLLKTQLLKDDIKACYKGLDVVTKGLGLYKESNQRKWTRYIVNKNIRHEMLPMLHGMKIKREDGTIDFKLISKQDKLMGYKKMITYSAGLNTDLYEVIDNATEAQIEAVTTNKVRVANYRHSQFGVSIATDIYANEARKEEKFETLTASHNFVNIPKEEIKETTITTPVAPKSYVREEVEEDTKELPALADKPKNYVYAVTGDAITEEEKQRIIDYMTNVMDAPVCKNDNNGEKADEIDNINERSVENDDENEQTRISSNKEKNSICKELCEGIEENGTRNIGDNNKSKEPKIESICVPRQSTATAGFAECNKEIWQPQYTLEELQDIFNSIVPMPSTYVATVLGVEHKNLVEKIEEILVKDEDAYQDYAEDADGIYSITMEGRQYLKIILAEDAEEENDDYIDNQLLQQVAFKIEYENETDPIKKAQKYIQYQQQLQQIA